MLPVALAYVNRARWVALCPFLCGGAHIAEGDTFLCSLCENGGTGRAVSLVWPSAEDRKAIEQALAHRPPIARNWNVNETIGLLLAENVEHGMFDSRTGAITGDIGADQMRAPALAALSGQRELRA